jgi:WD40 repeat protein
MTIRMWDAETGAAIGQPLVGHAGQVRSVVYSPDGRHIISGSNDKTIQIWDAKTGSAIRKPLQWHSSEVRSVACSPDGRHIASGSSDGTIRIWDAETGTPVGKPLVGHRKSVAPSLTLLMDGTSSLDPVTRPFESGMLRLVLPLASL